MLGGSSGLGLGISNWSLFLGVYRAFVFLVLFLPFWSITFLFHVSLSWFITFLILVTWGLYSESIAWANTRDIILLLTPVFLQWHQKHLHFTPVITLISFLIWNCAESFEKEQKDKKSRFTMNPKQGGQTKYNIASPFIVTPILPPTQSNLAFALYASQKKQPDRQTSRLCGNSFSPSHT